MVGYGPSSRDGGRLGRESETILSHIQGPVAAESERLFAALSRLVQCGGLSIASHRAQKASRVGSGGLCRRMLWSQGTFVDGEGPLQQGLYLLIVPLNPIEHGEVVNAGPSGDSVVSGEALSVIPSWYRLYIISV